MITRMTTKTELTVKRDTAGTKVKEISRIQEESKQTRTNRDKEPEMEIEKNVEEKLEHLGKQEKYLFILNGSFRQDKEEMNMD